MIRIIIPVLLIIIYVSQSVEYKYNYEDLIDMSKRESGDYYLEQCAKVNFIMGQLGIVNVLIFLENSWPFSYKQATMLKNLKDRLEHSNVPEILFFAIIKDSSIVNDDYLDNINDENMELEAWREVAPDEVNEILNINNLINQPLINIISSDIIVIEDNDELNIWHELKGLRDQIIVIDRCGKLTYQIIIPWSILHFPYVKAAILSTHNDDPCDVCETYASTFNYKNTSHVVSDTANENITVDSTEAKTSTLINEEENQSMESTITQLDSETTFSDKLLPIVDTTDSYFDELQNRNIEFSPLRIIMRAPHYHIDGDSTKKHEYLVLKLNDENFHGHINDVSMKIEESYAITVNDNANESMINGVVFEKDESPGFYGEVADYWRDINNDYKSEDIQKDHNDNWDSGIVDINEDTSIPQSDEESITDDIGNVSTVENEDIESRNKLLAHYSQLLPWLHYVLNK